MAVAPVHQYEEIISARSDLLHRPAVAHHTAHVKLESKKNTDFPTASQPLVPIEALALGFFIYDICTIPIQDTYKYLYMYIHGELDNSYHISASFSCICILHGEDQASRSGCEQGPVSSPRCHRIYEQYNSSGASVLNWSGGMP